MISAGFVMDKEWRIEIPGFGILRVAPKLLDELASFRQLKNNQPESGGVLIGKHLNSGGAMVIDNFTPPQPTDKQGRCLYFRSEAHNKLVNQVWKESGGHSTYVGLWHTHPELRPNHSPTDLKDWRNALGKSRYEGNRLFFFIIGLSHICCWMGEKNLFKSKINLIGEYEIGN